MSSSDTPDKDDRPEEVDAEIVENDDASATDETEPLEAETIEEVEEVSEEAEDEASETSGATTSGQEEASTEEEAEAATTPGGPKEPQLITPGVILMGIMALALIVVFLNQGSSDKPAKKIAEEKTAVTETRSADLLSAPEKETSAPVEVETAEVEDVTAEVEVGNTTSNELVEVAELAVAETSEEVAEEPTDPASAEEVAELAEENKTPEQIAEERRLAAIERARERREARSEEGVDEALNEENAPAEGAEVTLAEKVTEEVAEVTEQSETAEPEVAQIAVAEAVEEIDADISEEEAATTVADAAEAGETDEGSEVAVKVAEAVTSEADEGGAEVEATNPEELTLTDAAEVAELELNEAEPVAPAAGLIMSDAKLASTLENLKEDVTADVLAETKATISIDNRRLERQEEEINQLRNELDKALAAQDKRAEQLEARLNVLMRRDVAAATKQAALSIALTNLQRQMSSGRPFAEQLSVLEQLAPGTQGIRDLKPLAEKGLPTMIGLRSSFSDAARKTLAAAKRGDADGAVEKFGANLAGLFSVRKAGMVEGDSPSAIISRAEVRLEEGDLYGCLQELSDLEGDAATAMAPWISSARSVVAADQLLDEVSNRILATL